MNLNLPLLLSWITAHLTRGSFDPCCICPVVRLTPVAFDPCCIRPALATRLATLYRRSRVVPESVYTLSGCTFKSVLCADIWLRANAELAWRDSLKFTAGQMQHTGPIWNFNVKRRVIWMVEIQRKIFYFIGRFTGSGNKSLIFLYIIYSG